MKAHHNVHQRMQKVRHWLRLDKMPKMVRIAVVSVVGGVFLVGGVVMIVTPGPAFVLIPAGLAMLALEFQWAERLLLRALAYAQRARDKVRSS